MDCYVCVDDRGGMLFHGRRQSRDRAVRADLLRDVQGKRLWVSPYTLGQFAPEEHSLLTVDPCFLAKAGWGECCFVEDQPLRPWLERIGRLTLYRWNRVYPADLSLGFSPGEAGWTLENTAEFPGYSHPTITKEVYVR